MARYWYSYNGVGNPFGTSSYQRANIPFSPPCTVGSEICVVNAAGAPGSLNPNSPFSPNIINYIAIALTSSTPKPSGGKAYVYKRSS